MMKIFHYFLGFVNAMLAFLTFSSILSYEYLSLGLFVIKIALFGMLSASAFYNIYQGYKTHKAE